MAKSLKVIEINLDNVKLNFERNFARERTVETYDSAAMRADMAERGQQTPADLLKIGPDEYEPMRGNRRAFNLKKLKESGIEDPLTCRTDKDGNPIKGTGKPFSTIRAIVYEGLTERERIQMMSDHDKVRGLSKAELQLFLEGLFPIFNDRECCILAANLLERYYPPTREIKPIDSDNGADFANYYKGVTDTAKRRFHSPVVLHEQALNVLRGKQAWPTNKEVYEGLKIYEKEVDADKLGRLDRQTPGPIFMAWFDNLVAKKTATNADGKKPKPVSMFNRSQLEDSIKVSDSRIAKWFGYLFLRDDRVKPDMLSVLCKALKTVEGGGAWDSVLFETCWNAASEADGSAVREEVVVTSGTPLLNGPEVIEGEIVKS